jgi:hypothetical protein
VGGIQPEGAQGFYESGGSSNLENVEAQDFGGGKTGF